MQLSAVYLDTSFYIRFTHKCVRHVFLIIGKLPHLQKQNIYCPVLSMI